VGPTVGGKPGRREGEIGRVVTGRFDQRPHLFIEVLVRELEREIR